MDMVGLLVDYRFGNQIYFNSKLFKEVHMTNNDGKTSSNGSVTTPEKKISKRQYELFKSLLSEHDIELPQLVQEELVTEGVVVSRTRNTTRRGWKMNDGTKVYPSLSFKGISGNTPTKEMEEFRSSYYELLEKSVEVIQT